MGALSRRRSVDPRPLFAILGHATPRHIFGIYCRKAPILDRRETVYTYACCFHLWANRIFPIQERGVDHLFFICFSCCITNLLPLIWKLYTMAGDFPNLSRVIMAQWPEPDMIDPTRRRWYLQFSAILALTASMLLCARLFSQIKSTKGLGVDDAFICISWVSYIPLSNFWHTDQVRYLLLCLRGYLYWVNDQCQATLQPTS